MVLLLLLLLLKLSITIIPTATNIPTLVRTIFMIRTVDTSTDLTENVDTRQLFINLKMDSLI